MDVQNGEVIGECKKRHRHQEFLIFLKTEEKQSPKDKSLHLIVDNYATYRHEKVKNWAKKGINVFTCTSFQPVRPGLTLLKDFLDSLQRNTFAEVYFHRLLTSKKIE